MRAPAGFVNTHSLESEYLILGIRHGVAALECARNEAANQRELRPPHRIGAPAELTPPAFLSQDSLIQELTKYVEKGKYRDHEIRFPRHVRRCDPDQPGERLAVRIPTGAGRSTPATASARHPERKMKGCARRFFSCTQSQWVTPCGTRMKSAPRSSGSARSSHRESRDPSRRRPPAFYDARRDSADAAYRWCCPGRRNSGAGPRVGRRAPPCLGHRCFGFFERALHILP